MPRRRTDYGNAVLKAVEDGRFTLAERAGTLLNLSRKPDTGRVSKARLHDTAASSSNGVPIGSEAFAVKLSDLHPGGQDPSFPFALPTHNSSDESLNIEELRILKESGEQVVMPSGVLFSTGASSSSLQEPRDFPAQSTPFLAHTPPPLSTGFTQSLVDLLDLHNFGEPVIWPPGFDAQKAKHFVQDYKQAICVCQLYGYSSP